MGLNREGAEYLGRAGKERLFAVMHLGPWSILDTELPPEFPGVDGLMQLLDLSLFYWERVHENKSRICSLRFCRCVGS